MSHESAHGHHIRFEATKGSDEEKAFEAAASHLRGMSFEAAEKIFNKSRDEHRIDISAGGHTVTLVTEADNYRFDFKH
jgi:hypothetical protein